MRRKLLPLVVLVAGLGAASMFPGSPAGAGAARLLPGAAGSTARTSPVPPLTSGYVALYNSLDQLVPTAGDVGTPTDPSGNASSLSMPLVVEGDAGPTLTYQVDVSTDGTGPLKLGQTYPTPASVGSASINVSDAGDPIGATDTNVQVRVDQLTEVGGTVTSAAVQLQGVGIEAAVAYDIVPTTPHRGYYTFGSTGALTGFGNDHYLSYLTPYVSSEPVVAMEQTGDGGGYWMLATDGGLFAYGDAGFYGSPQALRLNGAMVGMAATADGGGYWMAGSDGGVFAYGDAGFHGSAGNLRLNAPIVGMAATPDGRGYWLVAADGGVFAYGDAGFHGSAGGIRLNRPIVGMAATPDGRGYWLVASDGGVFAYGDATFHGSAGGLVLRAPVVGMATSEQGDGYWLVAADGGIFAYGDAAYEGSVSATDPGTTDVVGISSDPGPTG